MTPHARKQPQRGGDTLEYRNMVEQIITAEHSARALAEESRRKRELVEAAYGKNRDAWVDKLFALIVGVEP